MLLNGLKLSFPQLVSNPFHALINIFGLAVGLVSFYILWEYSISELKSDQYHKDFNRIAVSAIIGNGQLKVGPYYREYDKVIDFTSDQRDLSRG